MALAGAVNANASFGLRARKRVRHDHQALHRRRTRQTSLDAEASDQPRSPMGDEARSSATKLPGHRAGGPLGALRGLSATEREGH